MVRVMAEISGFYVACCDCMGRNSGKLPGSGQERFLIRDINVCTKVKVACYLAIVVKRLSSN
jgi:hypothetical protein